MSGACPGEFGPLPADPPRLRAVRSLHGDTDLLHCHGGHVQLGRQSQHCIRNYIPIPHRQCGVAKRLGARTFRVTVFRHMDELRCEFGGNGHIASTLCPQRNHPRRDSHDEA
jgi:hypothetical protein